MVRIRARQFILFPALILSVAMAAGAQIPKTGQLTGTVTDASGAVIPGAEITAKNLQTGREFRNVADASGVWRLDVPSGSYLLKVILRGFQPVDLTDVQVETGATATKNVTLQVGGLAETLIVTASRHQEEEINAPSTVTVITEEAIRNSPSPNIGELLRPIPGMNVVQTSAREFNITSRAATALFSGSQLALIDGRTIYHDDMGYLCWDGQAINLEQIKQAEVIRGPASAVWGANAMNGIINNIPPAHRFNAGLDFNYKRYLGSVSVGYVGSAYWNDVIGPTYSGPTDAYTVVNAGGGVAWGENRKYTAMLKISNLANTPIQNHVFGDILKRQVSGEFRMRF